VTAVGRRVEVVAGDSVPTFAQRDRVTRRCLESVAGKSHDPLEMFASVEASDNDHRSERRLAAERRHGYERSGR
jgi:hypothetical protein